MKNLLVWIALFLTISCNVRAEEGMWIPMLLEKYNIRQMQEMGLRLSAGDIYSINHSSLKDAIVQFGGGCTGEIVSAEGLMLTNHHCGLGAIQRLSSMEHDYLTNGFWAATKSEEIPCPGLTVTLLVRMEDVTDKVLLGTDPNSTQLARQEIIRQNIDRIEKEAVKGTSYEARVRPFYYGNQYYLIVNEVFRDIRLAGAPPSAIGQFGGDTDNWMWPRHGGDFSVFRIYAGKDNKPAPYSKENLPYKPGYFLPVSIKGYQKGDFTFVFGYPGSTREYLTSYGVDQVANKENPVRIELRQKRLEIMNEAMSKDQLTRIQYTSKHQGIANGWKKMMGETNGIKRMDAIAMKRDFESGFRKWADTVKSEEIKVKSEDERLGMKEQGLRGYKGLLDEMEKTYKSWLPFDIASVYITEAGMGIEIVRFASGFRELVKISQDQSASKDKIARQIENLQKSSRSFYKDYQPGIDKEVMIAMLEEMNGQMEKAFLPGIFETIGKEYASDFKVYTGHLFATSLFTDSMKLNKYLNHFKISSVKEIIHDPAYM